MLNKSPEDFPEDIPEDKVILKDIYKELLQERNIVNNPIIYNKYKQEILQISLEQQLVNLIDVPLELCEVVQLYIYRNVY